MKKIYPIVFVCFLFPFLSHSQNITVDKDAINQLIERLEEQARQDSIKKIEYAKIHGEESLFKTLDNGQQIGLVYFDENNTPVFFGTDNYIAAITTNTRPVMQGGSSGYNLTGNGINIGEWDGGRVRHTHVELVGRVTQIDNPASLSGHATHVAGTMIASGVDTLARGMATAATISAYDFNNDATEMATFAGNNAILSNHSYGRISGWYQSSGDWYWYGDTSISATEDWAFGFYTQRARTWDLMAFNAPFYTIVKSAGNDRNQGPNNAVQHFVRGAGNNWVSSNTARPRDCMTAPGGYDCVSDYGTAKNIITVGAVADIPNGYNAPNDVVMSSFSGWGPTDDGRIKPDLVGNGVGVFSTGSNNNTHYYSSSGTSMSAPNVTGSLALIQQKALADRGGYLLSSALKGLAIHTCDEAGNNPGPDYRFGWGLMNTKRACDVIEDTIGNQLFWDTLSNGDTLSFTYFSDGTQPLRATICWTDPAGFPSTVSLNPTAIKLMNDLDLRIIRNSNQNVSSPWVLNPASPANAASTGDNIRDNVEQVLINNPAAGFYTIRISHKGSLINNEQVVSVIVSGISAPNAVPTADFSASDSMLCPGDSVLFTDLTQDSPTAWQWLFPGGTPATSSAQNPAVQYNTPGIYSVTLIATNGFGSDTLVKTNYIQVDSLPNIQFNLSQNTACQKDSAFTLIALPTGGSFSGNGVIGNLFNPDTAGLGTHVISYQISTPGGCTVQDTTSITVFANPTVTHSAVSNQCLGSPAITLSGGSPIGGTYSGPGVIGNQFFPDTAGVGNHVLVYSFTNGNGCSDSVSINVSVLSPNAATISSLGNVCINDSAFVLTQGSPVGGFYTGVGVDSATSTFDPAIAGVGSHLITYTLPLGGCTSTDSATIVVNNSPSTSFSMNPSAVCAGSSAILLSGGLPTGGSYSGTGVFAGSFIPDTAGVGIFPIQYTFTDTNGCSSASIDSVEVLALSIPTIGTLPSVCENAGTITLSGASPAGGYYSGIGVDSATSTFNPAIAGVGTHIISYTDTTSLCGSTAQGLLSVNPLPTVSLVLPVTSVCSGSGSISLLGGSPAGGTYSGTGVSGTTFDPQALAQGSYAITYSFTDSNGCSASAIDSISVINSAAVSFAPIGNFCISDSAVALNTGSPAGGTYSGAGVDTLNNVFDPSIAGIGQHWINYAINSGGCIGVDSILVTVQALPTVTLSLSNTAICDTTTTVVLSGGSPMGGSFSGIGVVGNTFDPSVSGFGTFVITYTFSDSIGCSATASETIVVSQNLSVTFTDTTICNTTSDFIISNVSPQGGIFNGPGVVGGTQFSPSQAGLGIHQIVYDYNANGCIGSDTALFTVNNGPSTTLASLGSVCVLEDSLVLFGGSPSGGFYSGNHVVTSVFLPSQAGIGNYNINYNYSEPNSGCVATATQVIRVTNGEASVELDTSAYCEDHAEVNLLGDPRNGIFSGNGITGGELFTPSIAGVGSHAIQYQVGGACPDTVNFTIDVHPTPIISPITGPSMVWQGGEFTYLVSPINGAGYQWTATNGSILQSNNNLVKVIWGNQPTGRLKVVVTNDFGCKDSTFVVVDLWALSVGDLQDENQIQLYPNPASNRVNLVYTNGVGSEVTLMDIRGRVIWTQRMESEQIEFSVNSLAPGVYNIAVLNNNVVVNKKLIVH